MDRMEILKRDIKEILECYENFINKKKRNERMVEMLQETIEDFKKLEKDVKALENLFFL